VCPMKKRSSPRSKTSTALRVLVIDDDENLSQTMIDSLREDGITAWAVRPIPSAPPEAVVATAVLFEPHVILIDIVMPVNTARLVMELKSCPELASTVLVGCSGHAALAEGITKYLDGFLHKPFDRRELFDALQEAAALRPLEGTRRRRTPSGSPARRN
jgi:CheY-like chemotaxis protein